MSAPNEPVYVIESNVALTEEQAERMRSLFAEWAEKRTPLILGPGMRLRDVSQPEMVVELDETSIDWREVAVLTVCAALGSAAGVLVSVGALIVAGVLA